ncbi:MAG: GNAT family N-acetyltransferase [Gemmatimonadaceae bacterium]
MPFIQCICGERQFGTDDAALFAAMRTHADAAHADLAITDAQVQQLLAARSRMTDWDGAPATLSAPPDIRPLTAERVDDFLRFFDRDAFMDNPAWSGCYCMFYRFGGSAEEWERRTLDDNRREHESLIRTGRANGLLAYVGDRAVAWCHAAPRAELPGLDRNEDLRTDDAVRVGAIVCFVVAAPYRGQRIAAQLLESSCTYLRERGLTVAEAYPAKQTGSEAQAYRGPLQMYLDAGFMPRRESDRFVVVRRTL